VDSGAQLRATGRLAEVSFERRDGVRIARIDGDIDLSNASDVESQLDVGVPDSAVGLVVDLSATSHLDSSGFWLLFALYRKLGRRGQKLRLVVPDDAPIRGVVSIAGLGDAVGMSSTLAGAVREVSPQAPKRGGS
jgi:anti-anti-sigma factor